MAQIRQVVSESLQATIRRLLPSQQGFTEDLQASNVIQPIIDLTPTAEGDVIPADLQRSLSFQGVTEYVVNNTTTTIANTPGFYRVFGSVTVNRGGSGTPEAIFRLTDGVTVKRIWGAKAEAGTEFFINNVDFEVFLAAGESITAQASTNIVTITVGVRQIADVNGNIVNPAGFTSS